MSRLNYGNVMRALGNIRVDGSFWVLPGTTGCTMTYFERYCGRLEKDENPKTVFIFYRVSS